MFERFKSLFHAKAPVEYNHPEFGVLTCDSGLWSGTARRDGREIRFYIGGTALAPDPGLLKRLCDLLEHFPVVEQSALDFLHTQSPAIIGQFTFYSLDFLWEDKPNMFAMEFSLAGDDDGIWRVEFADGQPKYAGRDD